MNKILLSLTLTLFVLFKPAYAIDCIADYELDVSKSLTIQEIAFIQTVTESPGLSRFSYAVTPTGGLEINQLNISDRAFLINILLEHGITVDRKSFLSDGGYYECMNSYIVEYQQALNNLLEKANIESNSLGNLELNDVLEMIWVVSSDGVSLFSDLAGVGAALKVSKGMHKISKSAPILRKGLEKLNSRDLRKLKKFFDFFESTRWIAVSELINANFSVSALDSNSKAEVQSILIEGFGNFTGRIVAGKLSESQRGYLSKLFYSKSIDAMTVIITNTSSAVLKNNETKKVLREILSDLVDLVPVVGPLHHTYVSLGEIAGRTTTSDAATQAWDTYLLRYNLFKQILTDTRERDLEARLSELVNVSNNINIEVFRDVPVNHWAFVPIYSLKKLGVVGGDQYGYFHPENKVSIGEFLKFITRSMFNDESYGNKTNVPFEQYFTFLSKKGIDLSAPNGEKVVFTTELSNASISRGYASKIVANIINYRNSHINSECIHAPRDNGFLSVSCVREYNSSNTDNGSFPQLKNCLITNSGWDTCSDILRIYKIVDGKSNSGFSAKSSLLRSELSKIIFKSLVHVKGMSSSPTLRELEIGLGL